MRSGIIELTTHNGTLRYAAYAADYWSSQTSSDTAVYALTFDSVTINPSYSSIRHVGFPLRCLSTV